MGKRPSFIKNLIFKYSLDFPQRPHSECLASFVVIARMSYGLSSAFSKTANLPK